MGCYVLDISDKKHFDEIEFALSFLGYNEHIFLNYRNVYRFIYLYYPCNKSNSAYNVDKLITVSDSFSGIGNGTKEKATLISLKDFLNLKPKDLEYNG